MLALVLKTTGLPWWLGVNNPPSSAGGTGPTPLGNTRSPGASKPTGHNYRAWADSPGAAAAAVTGLEPELCTKRSTGRRSPSTEPRGPPPRQLQERLRGKKTRHSQDKKIQLLKKYIYIKQSDLCFLPPPLSAQPRSSEKLPRNLPGPAHGPEGLWDIRATVRGHGLCESSEEGHRNQEPGLGRPLERLLDGPAEKGICVGSS